MQCHLRCDCGNTNSFAKKTVIKKDRETGTGTGTRTGTGTGRQGEDMHEESRKGGGGDP